MSRGMLYIEKDSFIHNLDGGVKILFLIIWTVVTFMFMDLRIFLLQFIMGLILIMFSKIEFRKVKPLLLFVLIFTIFNSLFLAIITPKYGSEIVGSESVLFTLYKFTLTKETLWYILTLSMKYLALTPVTILFIFATHPSRFASSLNRIGIPYRVAYAVNIALRYIPDIGDEFKTIMNAQEARGVPFKKGEASIFQRLSNYRLVLLPLIQSSLVRIDSVSNAMGLRGFGVNKKRSWFNRTPLSKGDYLVFTLSIFLLVVSLFLRERFGGFWYPFK